MTEPASDELIAEIEAGLEGVTPGPWQKNGKFIYATGSVDTWSGPVWGAIAGVEDLEAEDGEGRNWHCSGNVLANSAHLARCHPGNIAALIARIREQDATIKRMDEALERFEADDYTYRDDEDDRTKMPIRIGDIRAARAARKEPT